MDYELYHHGILGMHWGIRRYQNKDGSLTPAGRRHYGYDQVDKVRKDLEDTRNPNGNYKQYVLTKSAEEYYDKKVESDPKLKALSTDGDSHKELADLQKEAIEYAKKNYDKNEEDRYASELEKKADELQKKADSQRSRDKDILDKKQAYKEANKKWQSNHDAKSLKEASLASLEYNWAKKDAQDERIREKLKAEKSKSNHRLKLEEHYRDKGMSKEEAEIAAYKREKTEIILAAVAATTVTAAVAYVGYKHYDAFADKVIKPGTVLQNISVNSNKGVQDAFYASYKSGDKQKYIGLFGNQLGGLTGSNPVYKMDAKVAGKLKIASNKTATKALADLVKNEPGFADDLKTHLAKYQMHDRFGLNAKALRSLNKGVVDDNVWEATNHWMVEHEGVGGKVNSKIYEKLKSLGYDGILDVNDMKYSGYNSKRPVIVFNGSQKLKFDSIRQLGQDEIEKAHNTAYAKVVNDAYRKQFMQGMKDSSIMLAPYAVITGTVAGLNVASTKKNDTKIVEEYRKEHPNTKLSYQEILRMQKREQINNIR